MRILIDERIGPLTADGEAINSEYDVQVTHVWVKPYANASRVSVTRRIRLRMISRGAWRSNGCKLTTVCAIRFLSIEIYCSMKK